MTRASMPFPAFAVSLLLALVAVSPPRTASAQEEDRVVPPGIGYVQGDGAASVVVVEFGDFGCPACGEFARETLPALRDEFIDTGRVRWTFVPFVLGAFPNGGEAARAAECAADQDAFWAMHDRLYADQEQWLDEGDPREIFVGYAADHGLDADAFERCYRDDAVEERTERANEAARAARVRGTPTFFVNGRRVEGALPIDPFRELLTDAEAEGPQI
ncbi:MAG: DsbA family protein [Gemmatimonadota bacterium]